MISSTEQIKSTKFGSLNGWAGPEITLALAAFQRSAVEILSTGHGFRRSSKFSGIREDWLPTCEAALKAQDGKAFFEKHFKPFVVNDYKKPEGLFTGYYEPLANGSLTKSSRFHVPIYRRPPELVALPSDIEAQRGLRYGHIVNHAPAHYFTRFQIENGALDGRGLEICWLDNWIDAFFIHIQGSGRIALEDGSTLRLAFAAKNGQAYTSIGAALLAKGHGTSETMSMQFLRNWMEQNPKAGRQLMWENNSYIFFRDIELDDPTLGALGAAQVNLTPLCSLAIDRNFWMYGTPFWLETSTPAEARQGSKPFTRLMIGQDTGTAIQGALRGDVYWGWGDDAILNAGHMKSTGRMTALLPDAVVRRLGH
jgi:membrane-bound lytic murein transglycosylase A